ncbi:hypothetical protein [Reinekea sp. G2M2-21]|uniref:hypothetical protein n=1 Tax=Reinekea sp. G2M2-21 TaxID=2788942 RepID=UPI0018A9A913|nr:hypothetical protein [Reinekea sp. G2M2-21]
MNRLLPLVAAAALVGCNEVPTSDSDDVKTSGIEAEFFVSNSGDIYTVRAELIFGDDEEPTYLLASGGDELTATLAGQTKTLRRSGHGHEAQFSAADGTLVIDFNRTEFLSALGSSIQLTATGSFSSPSEGQTFNYDEDGVELRFPASVAEDYKSLNWTVSCTASGDTETRQGSTSQGLQDGLAYIRFSTIFSNGPQLLDYPSQGCEVAFTLDKDVTGSVSAEFKTGQFSGRLRSHVSIVVLP